MNAREACDKMAEIEEQILSPCCHAPMVWFSRCDNFQSGLPFIVSVLDADHGRCTNCHNRVEVDEFDWKDGDR